MVAWSLQVGWSASAGNASSSVEMLDAIARSSAAGVCPAP
mgnify:CR=1